MFGRSESIPCKYHGRAKLTHVFASNKIQFFIIQSLSELNSTKETDAFEFSNSEDFAVTTSFEVGIAEKAFFHYLEPSKASLYWLRLAKNDLSSILDFLLIVKYYRNRDEKLVPLRFDYFVLRFLFASKTFELLVFHERGIRRIQIRELLIYILKKISGKLEKAGFKGLIISDMRVV
jgi:hypothetical protein